MRASRLVIVRVAGLVDLSAVSAQVLGSALHFPVKNSGCADVGPSFRWEEQVLEGGRFFVLGP
jgi:hypothetical protein